MSEDRRKGFQGNCLVASEGWKYMHMYDRLPQAIKDRLKSSDFNLCTACINTQAYFMANDNGDVCSEAYYLRAIKTMETEIRNESLTSQS